MRNPEVINMINKALTNPCDLQCFINNHDELIVSPELNAYFKLEDLETELDFKCKVLEWLSFHVADNHWFDYTEERINLENFINYMLGTHFNHDDFQYIYQELGNRVNHKLTIGFIESNYDMKLLGKEMLTK